METLFQESPASPACVQTFRVADDFSPLPANTTHSLTVWPVPAGRGMQVGAELSTLSVQELETRMRCVTESQRGLHQHFGLMCERSENVTV